MRNSKYKTVIITVFGGLLILGVIGVSVLSERSDEDKERETHKDHKNIAYVIDGQEIKLENGVAETAAAPGSAAKVVTSYFGNELVTDLDGDGANDDIAFVLTQTTGGSGTFFYAVAALNTEDGYVGSDGYLLGDRIAPQTTEVSPNPRHRNVVVFNYVDRALDEPISAEPSVGKSVFLKIVPLSMQWAIVEPDFEGESRL